METAVVVEHLPTGLRGEASELRSQLQNRQAAIHRLRVRLALEIRAPKADGPSSCWRRRAEKGRLLINARHADFPALLSEALDVIAANEFQIAPAANLLVVSTSQLIKLLRMEGDALAIVNQHRTALGQPLLR